MIIADMQVKQDYSLAPFSQEAKDLIRSYRPNQIVKAKISGIRKEASVPQFRMFHACMRTIADNTSDSQWNDLVKVKVQLKHLLNFFKSTVVLPDGSIHFELDSFAFSNYSKVFKEKIIERSLPILAKKIGITVDELLVNCERYS